MKKILAICTSPDRGGLELYFISLVKYFSNQSHIFTACRRNSHISKKIQSNRILIKKNNIFIEAELFSDDGKKSFRVKQKGKLNTSISLGHKVGMKLLKLMGKKFKKKI